MIRVLDFIVYFGLWAAVIVAGAILAGCGNSTTGPETTPARLRIAIEMQYYGYNDFDTDPQKESSTASVYDDRGDLVHILFNSDEYDTIWVPVCSLTVEFRDNYTLQNITFWPELGVRYLVRHPVIEEH